MRIDSTKIRIEQAKRKLTRADISRLGGLSIGTLNGAMCEDRISQATAQKIANALGLKVADIIKPE